MSPAGAPVSSPSSTTAAFAFVRQVASQLVRQMIFQRAQITSSRGFPVGQDPRGVFSPRWHSGSKSRIGSTIPISVIDTRYATRVVPQSLRPWWPEDNSALMRRGEQTLLHRQICIPGPDSVRQLPHRLHLRRHALGSGAGRLWRRHRRQSPPRRRKRHRAL